MSSHDSHFLWASEEREREREREREYERERERRRGRVSSHEGHYPCACKVSE